MNGFWDRLKEMSAGLNQQQQSLYDRQFGISNMMQNQANADRDSEFRQSQLKQGLLGLMLDAENKSLENAWRDKDLDLRGRSLDSENEYRNRSLEQQKELALEDMELRRFLGKLGGNKTDPAMISMIMQLLDKLNGGAGGSGGTLSDLDPNFAPERTTDRRPAPGRTTRSMTTSPPKLSPYVHNEI